ncbi:type 2 DNA topoisomerase 6 subunit B-like isoform X1 [Rhinatrema bivittatum]|uniref:type 2 DNA topoisomerase 6 subunit B-like isoform X1 n=1 Tax=Rhinatrema bivittatum TaxID=194408 RepID=UPI00112940AD|nr:type 2 DNA topoisomerase 6 subunit B-like isoform X1 [Rhinatrema bivittatum]
MQKPPLFSTVRQEQEGGSGSLSFPFKVCSSEEAARLDLKRKEKSGDPAGVWKKQYRGHSLESQEKLQQAQSLVTDCICSIVTSSADSGFRERCLSDMQVTDTQGFRTVVQDSLHRTALNRLLVSRTCNLRKELLEKPNVNQLTPCTYPEANRSQSQGNASCIREGFPMTSVDLWTHCLHVQDLSDNGSTSNSIHMSQIYDTFKDGSLQGQQEDKLWLQEVSKLSDWTC